MVWQQLSFGGGGRPGDFGARQVISPEALFCSGASTPTTTTSRGTVRALYSGGGLHCACTDRLMSGLAGKTGHAIFFPPRNSQHERFGENDHGTAPSPRWQCAIVVSSLLGWVTPTDRPNVPLGVFHALSRLIHDSERQSRGSSNLCEESDPWRCCREFFCGRGREYEQMAAHPPPRSSVILFAVAPSLSSMTLSRKLQPAQWLQGGSWHDAALCMRRS